MARRDQKEPTKEERIAEGRTTLRDVIDAALSGCGDPNHKEVEEAAQRMLRHSFLVEVLPAKVAEAVVRYYVFDALHNDVPSDGNPLEQMFGRGKPDLSKMFAKLGDASRVMFAMNIAGTVLRTLGRDFDDAALNTAPSAVSTGVYI